jgi:hypothetical protein
MQLHSNRNEVTRQACQQPAALWVRLSPDCEVKHDQADLQHAAAVSRTASVLGVAAGEMSYTVIDPDSSDQMLVPQ